MKTNQWIKDVKTVIGCNVPQLFKVLANIAEKEEDSDMGLFARKCQFKILECIEDVKLFLGEIRRNAQDFTLHDIQHCINVIDFMGQMLVDVKSLNPAEISFFIYSALLHDIGMVKLPDEDIALDDLREDHGDRSARFIRERIILSDDGNPFNFGEYDEVYMEYLPFVCASHMQEFSFVEKLPQSYILDGMEVDISLCAILLRLADAMDLKRKRAPYPLYQFLVNRSVSSDHWKKHMSVTNCQVNENGVYRVDGICHEEFAHRCLYNHLDMIESEIGKVFKWKNGTHPRLILRTHIVERNIETKNYKMWHHSFSMDVLKITNLFMGEQLYGDKRLGLREIIQNSIDACMVRDELNKDLGTKQDYTYKPEIYIIFDWENNQIIIRDNGTGMNDYIIQNYFLNIGASYYSSNDFKKKNLKYSPSGYFGIGFLSSFMLSDDVYVRTAHWQEDVEYEFHFIKSDRFVTKIEKPKTFSGTEIRLNLDQFIKVFSKNSSNLNTESSEKDNIGVFLDQTFWILKVNQTDNNVLLCSIRTDTFLEFAKERDKTEYDYNIDLSEYLKDIEGIINLNSNDFFSKSKCLYEISELFPLEALRKGEMNICDNIKDFFPFVNNFYIWDNKSNSINEIKENNSDYYDLFIFFPTEGSKIEINDRKDKDSELANYEIREYFWLHSWNCLCTVNKNEGGRDTLTFNRTKLSLVPLNREAGIYEKLINYVRYKPSCFVALSGLDTNKMKSMIYIDSTSMLLMRGLKRSYWLKHARINLPLYIEKAFSFSFFKIESITMRIANPLIQSDSARRNIIDSSAVILAKIVGMCVILWLYDNIKDYKMAIKTTQYLKQLILKEWDSSVEGLVKPEKKPI